MEEKNVNLLEQKLSLLDQKLDNDFFANDSALLVNEPSSISDTGLLNEENNSFSLSVTDEEAKRAEEERQRIINEHNKRIKESPEYKAEIIYENYIKNVPNYFSGAQKRALKRKFLREAKAGKFDYLFDEEKQKRREERQRAKFEELNKKKEELPTINTNFHSVDEIPIDVQNKLKEISDSSIIE